MQPRVSLSFACFISKTAMDMVFGKLCIVFNAVESGGSQMKTGGLHLGVVLSPFGVLPSLPCPLAPRNLARQ